MMLSIPALQYSLFGNIEKKLIENGVLKPGDELQVFPTICPSPKFFEDLGITNGIQYVKFISSAYRLDLSGYCYYFFFRNKKADNLGFVEPSSIEVVRVHPSSKAKDHIMKHHYFGSESDSVLKMYSSPDFNDKSLMKAAVSTISSVLAVEFVSFVK